MFRKFSIKGLGIIFSVLLLLVIIVTFIESKSGDRTMVATLVEVEATQVSTIKIYPKSLNGKEIVLSKTDEQWFVNSNGKSYRADNATVDGMIEQLNGLAPIRMAATKEEKWAKFEVTDSLGTRVVFEHNGDVLSDIVIGKFSYRQPKNANPQMAMYGRQQGTMNTYVRLSDEDEVYAVDGFLSMSYNKDANAFRDKTVVEVDRSLISKIAFNYPDSSFVLEKLDTKWLVNGINADSMKVDKYLKAIQKLNCAGFSDNASMDLPLSVKIEGNNMPAIEVNGAIHDGKAIMVSSLNEGTIFEEEADRTFEKLFIGQSALLE